MSPNLSKTELSALAEKLLKGTSTREELQKLNQWYNDFDDYQVIVHSNESKEEVRQRLLAKINADLHLKKAVKSDSYSWKLAAVISILLISIASIPFLSNIIDNNKEVVVVPITKSISKTAAYGQKKSIQLPDGSLVKLNSGSTIQYLEDFSDGFRSVVLEGEAFFEVTRNVSKPFIIQTNHIQVEVLGTSFNVKSYRNDIHTDVAVKTGRVLVKKLASSDVLDLRPNEMAIFNNNSANLIKQNILNEESIFGWVQGNLVFDNEQFETVVEMISRWYGVEIKVNNIRSDKRITANLTNSTLNEVLESLSHTYKFNYQVDGNQITIE